MFVIVELLQLALLIGLALNLPKEIKFLSGRWDTLLEQ